MRGGGEAGKPDSARRYRPRHILFSTKMNILTDISNITQHLIHPLSKLPHDTSCLICAGKKQEQHSVGLNQFLAKNIFDVDLIKTNARDTLKLAIIAPELSKDLGWHLKRIGFQLVNGRFVVPKPIKILVLVTTEASPPPMLLPASSRIVWLHVGAPPDDVQRMTNADFVLLDSPKVLQAVVRLLLRKKYRMTMADMSELPGVTAQGNGSRLVFI